MSELVYRPASGLAALIAKKEVSSVEVTKAFFDRSEQLNAVTNSYLHLNRELAIAAATKADADLAAGKATSVLHGVPIAVKDNLTTTDAPTTSGSRTLGTWSESLVDQVEVRLRRYPHT